MSFPNVIASEARRSIVPMSERAPVGTMDRRAGRAGSR